MKINQGKLEAQKKEGIQALQEQYAKLMTNFDKNALSEVKNLEKKLKESERNIQQKLKLHFTKLQAS